MNQTILIIDDFASVRLYHMSYLTRKGYVCLGASDGPEALARLGQGRVDLILLDMVMPAMSGEEFVKRLNNLPQLAAIPVLVITSEESVARVRFVGGTRPIGVLGKPVMPDLLLQKVRQLLPPVPHTITS